MRLHLITLACLFVKPFLQFSDLVVDLREALKHAGRLGQNLQQARVREHFVSDSHAERTRVGELAGASDAEELCARMLLLRTVVLRFQSSTRLSRAVVYRFMAS